MLTGCKSSHNGFLDVSHSNGRLRISGWIGQLSCLTIFSTSLSVAAFLRRAGGSMLESTGSHGRGVEWRVLAKTDFLSECRYSRCSISDVRIGHSLLSMRSTSLVTMGCLFCSVSPNRSFSIWASMAVRPNCGWTGDVWSHFGYCSLCSH